MTSTDLRSPQNDLEQRRPVWEALSILFLDTALDEIDLAASAKILAESPYTDEQLAAIYHAEVTPVCESNIGMAPGFWSGFPDGWIEEGVLGRGLDAAQALAALRRMGKLSSWGWGGLQQHVLRLRGLSSAERG
jgi:hypothetical protein